MAAKNQTIKTENDSTLPIGDSQIAALERRHLLLGWFALLLFLTLGIGLEMMHGFKLGFYLDVQNSSRRLMWTLAHAHGTLFALIHIAFACSLGLLPVRSASALGLVSKCLTGALVVMPLGFFFGGLWMFGGDPGLGVLLVPAGALLLLSGVGIFSATLLGNLKQGAKEQTAGTRKAQAKPSSKPPRKKRRK